MIFICLVVGFASLNIYTEVEFQTLMCIINTYGILIFQFATDPNGTSNNLWLTPQIIRPNQVEFIPAFASEATRHGCLR
jgi:hypothetical protein